MTGVAATPGCQFFTLGVPGGGGNFCPDGVVTRQEVAKFLARALDFFYSYGAAARLPRSRPITEDAPFHRARKERDRPDAVDRLASRSASPAI